MACGLQGLQAALGCHLSVTGMLTIVHCARNLLAALRS